MAKALPAPDLNVFLNALEHSSLLTAEAVAKARESAAETPDAKAIARDLLKSGDLTRWQAGQLLHGYAGLVVGKYALLDQLGAGEMGRVYLAEHVQMNRRVALKVLSRRHTQRPEILQRFLDDAQKSAALDHRNLIHVYDVNQDGDRYFLVMEYVEGQDLQKLVEQSGKLPAAKALAYIRQVAEGLKHAHEKHVFHGDLKPTNLLVDAHGTVKVLDLGLGKLAADSSSVVGEDSGENAALASRIYHAPEQQSQGSDVDFRADIYSLGSTLYYLLTAKLPSGSSVTAEDVEAAAPGTPTDVAQLCQQLTAENPADRPQSMANVLKLIDGLDLPAAAPAAAAALPKARPEAKAEAKPEPAAGKPKVAAAEKTAPPKAKRPPVAKSLDVAPAAKSAPSASPAAPALVDEAEAAVVEVAAAEVAEKPAFAFSTGEDQPAADDGAAFGGFDFSTSGKKSTAKKSAAPTSPAPKTAAPKTASPKTAAAKGAASKAAAEAEPVAEEEAVEPPA
jgi:serine/threonine-protein kinase